MNESKLDLIIDGLSSPITMFIGTVNFCVGLPLNICVIIILTRGGGGLDGALIFALSQVLAEILFEMEAPFVILCYVNVQKLCFYYPVSMITATCMMARLLFQCCVCFERYVAVVHPLIFLKYKSIKYRLAVTVIIWLSSSITAIMTMFRFSDIPFNIMAAVYITVMSVMLFMSLSLLRSLKRPGPGVRQRDDGGVNVAKQKAFKIVSLNFLIFLIRTIPILMSFFIYYAMSEDAFVLAFFTGLNINVAISLTQPFLFLFQNGKLTCIG